jgi:L-amino acid N-acyltransferase YncA
MLVRLAHATDAEAIRAIYNVEVVESTVTFDIVPRSHDDQRDWLLAHAGAHPAIVAVEADEVIGFGSLSPYKDRAAYSTTVEDSVYVHRDWRRKGVGHLLLRQLLDLATTHGFHAVIARIVGDHEASITLHERCGFTLVGVEKQVGRKFGRWLDVVELQCLL